MCKQPVLSTAVQDTSSIQCSCDRSFATCRLRDCHSDCRRLLCQHGVISSSWPSSLSQVIVPLSPVSAVSAVSAVSLITRHKSISFYYTVLRILSLSSCKLISLQSTVISTHSYRHCCRHCVRHLGRGNFSLAHLHELSSASLLASSGALDGSFSVRSQVKSVDKQDTRCTSH